MLDLQKIRSKIDNLDEQIQALITERAHLAKQVAAAKYAEEANPIFYRPEREAEVLTKVIARNKGPLSDETLTGLFQQIMSSCLALQKPLSIAYLGPEGTYSQAAVEKHFGSSVETVAQQTIDDVFRVVEAGSVQYGVVPIENSTEGAVNQSLDNFIRGTSLKICGEIELAIHHCFLSNSSEVKRIYAHKQSLAQCRNWLAKNFASIECIAVNSNAEAARLAANEDGAAAIAGKSAADIYQLQVVASCIEDISNNTTRFVVLGQQEVPVTGNDKTSLLVSTDNKPGALYSLLQSFADHNVSMTRIESRPSRQGLWEYMFFIDIEGHIEDELVIKSLRHLKEHSSFMMVLGSYPRYILNKL
jgi:chorismate mutase/prephenate dehydratase